MPLQLPRPPSADRFSTDPVGYARDLTGFLNNLVQQIENEARINTTPAKAAFKVTNIAAPTTTIDGSTALLPDVVNFLGGIYATLLAKGIIRTKSGSG